MATSASKQALAAALAKCRKRAEARKRADPAIVISLSEPRCGKHTRLLREKRNAFHG
jgi:hypothetical protein